MPKYNNNMPKGIKIKVLIWDLDYMMPTDPCGALAIMIYYLPKNVLYGNNQMF